jgi:hypothetical protein
MSWGYVIFNLKTSLSAHMPITFLSMASDYVNEWKKYVLCDT